MTVTQTPAHDIAIGDTIVTKAGIDRTVTNIGLNRGSYYFWNGDVCVAVVKGYHKIGVVR